MAHLILFTILSLAVGSIYSQDACDPTVVDECGFKLYDNLMQPERIPSNEAELEAYCTLLREGRKCVEDKLQACPSILPVKTSAAYLEAVGFTIDDVCKEGGSQLGKKLLPHAPCLKEKLVDFGCTKSFFTKVEAAVLEERSEQMTAACCAFTQYDRCYNDAAKDKCGRPTARAVRSIVQGFGLFLVDRCLPFLADPERCNSRVPKALPADTRKVLSILPALTEIIANHES